jgi:replicative DNA helicase
MSDSQASDPFAQRVPPNDQQAEMVTLGGMMLNRDVIIDVSAILNAGDFYRPVHGLIFEAITSLDSAGEPVDMMTVAAKLLDTGYLSKLPTPAYLHDLVDACVTPANAEWFAKRVKAKSIRREIIVACSYGVEWAHKIDEDLTDQLVERVQARIHQATTGSASEDSTSWADVADETISAIEAAAEGATQGLSTGLTDLDSLIGGLGAGQLIIVAGRPAMGKSVLLADFCRQAAFRDNMTAALFSLEMSKQEFGRRIVSAETGIGLSTLKSGELTEDEWSKVMTFRAESDASKLRVIEAAGSTIESIRARARRIQQQHGLDLIAVDYLQLMIGSKQTDNRQAEVAGISRGLKLLAMELGVPVVAAAQLNRGVESRTDKRPTMADLRESGSIENDADVVILLHRPAYYDKATPRGAEIDLIVDKNRHGQQDTVIAVAQLHRSRLVDCAPKSYTAAALSKGN